MTVTVSRPCHNYAHTERHQESSNHWLQKGIGGSRIARGCPKRETEVPCVVPIFFNRHFVLDENYQGRPGFRCFNVSSSFKNASYSAVKMPSRRVLVLVIFGVMKKRNTWRQNCPPLSQMCPTSPSLPSRSAACPNIATNLHPYSRKDGFPWPGTCALSNRSLFRTLEAKRWNCSWTLTDSKGAYIDLHLLIFDLAIQGPTRTHPCHS